MVEPVPPCWPLEQTEGGVQLLPGKKCKHVGKGVAILDACEVVFCLFVCFETALRQVWKAPCLISVSWDFITSSPGGFCSPAAHTMFKGMAYPFGYTAVVLGIVVLGLRDGGIREHCWGVNPGHRPLSVHTEVEPNPGSLSWEIPTVQGWVYARLKEGMCFWGLQKTPASGFAQVFHPLPANQKWQL